MKYLLFILAFFPAQEDIPYKAFEEFEVTLDYQIRQFRDKDPKTVDFSSAVPKEPKSLLYLVVQVELKTLAPNEARVHVNSNLGTEVGNRKAEPGMLLKIDFGFIERVKERKAAHEATVFLMSSDRKNVSRIHLFVEENGTFLVNGQRRGKF
jgi:hypothetical protein